MISVREALGAVLAHSQPVGVEEVPIIQASGLVLDQDVISPRNIPPFNNSAMDGYALIAEDTATASGDHPALLRLLERIPAGSFPHLSVTSGAVTKVMTGAPIPPGADAVVRLEDTRDIGDNVLVLTKVGVGENIRLAGEDVRSGSLILRKGDRITPAGVGMLASIGRRDVSVYRRPVVAIIATGDEIVEPNDGNTEGKLINSNAYAIIPMVKEMGALPLYLGIAPDTKRHLREMFEAAVGRADVIISFGGVSTGDYDFVEEVWREMGAEIIFSAVAQRPGKPMVFGTIMSKLIFGLPGNPVSSMVTFTVYIYPAVLKMMGRKGFLRKRWDAIVTEDIRKKPGLTYFLRGVLRDTGSGVTVATTGEQGSGMLMSMVIGNCLIVLPPEVSHISTGETVEVIPLDDSFSFV